ncbi:MAG: TauD/TfdA family dioxygenase [Chloroflexota bacterium]|nr:TauD/TfdA family dioxygenase [Chloroflexota bacterium]
MTSPQALTTVERGSRAWTRETIDDPTTWYYTLSPACLAPLDAFVECHRSNSQPATEIRVGDSELADCGECLRPVLPALESGRGFAIIDRVPLDRYTADEATLIYWAIGQLLGIPTGQDRIGTLLYDVRDTGQSVTQGARFSVTNAESSFHIDGTMGPDLPDLLGLLCLNGAKSGGQSQFISAYALHNDLLEHDPDALHTLYRTFLFDRRSQQEAGELPYLSAPVFRWDGSELHIRYLHYYTQVGHARASQPLTAAQQHALAAVEDRLERPDLRVEFTLQPGQMIFWNNHWLLHNRTAFEDYPEVERRRHLKRLWLRQRDS